MNGPPNWGKKVTKPRSWSQHGGKKIKKQNVETLIYHPCSEFRDFGEGEGGSQLKKGTGAGIEDKRQRFGKPIPMEKHSVGLMEIQYCLRRGGRKSVEQTELKARGTA